MASAKSANSRGISLALMTLALGDGSLMEVISFRGVDAWEEKHVACRISAKITRNAVSVFAAIGCD
jgi:hypothetical protein